MLEAKKAELDAKEFCTFEVTLQAVERLTRVIKDVTHDGRPAVEITGEIPSGMNKPEYDRRDAPGETFYRDMTDEVCVGVRPYTLQAGDIIMAVDGKEATKRAIKELKKLLVQKRAKQPKLAPSQTTVIEPVSPSAI